MTAASVVARADADSEGLELAVGDIVVYASHGIGRITAVSAARRGQIDGVVWSGGSLTVTLPIDLARERLRPLSDEDHLAVVARTLRTEEPPSEQPWAKRLKETREKLASGRADGLAEIVRAGAQRERDALTTGKSGASPNDRALYLKARQLLIDEISLARTIEAADADLWIDTQLTADAR